VLLFSPNAKLILRAEIARDRARAKIEFNSLYKLECDFDPMRARVERYRLM